MSTVLYYYPTADYAKTGSFTPSTIWSNVDDNGVTGDFVQALEGHSFDLTIPSPSIPTGSIIIACDIQIYVSRITASYGYPKLYTRVNSVETGTRFSSFDMGETPNWGWTAEGPWPTLTVSEINSINRIGVRDSNETTITIQYASIRLMVEYDTPRAKSSVTWVL